MLDLRNIEKYYFEVYVNIETKVYLFILFKITNDFLITFTRVLYYCIFILMHIHKSILTSIKI